MEGLHYLIHSNGKGREIYVSGEADGDEYGRIQEAFATEAHGGKAPASEWDRWADMIRLHADCVTSNGVRYDWGLASAAGAYFNLIKTPDVTPEQLKAAKNEIRRGHDVVSMHVIRIDEMI